MKITVAKHSGFCFGVKRAIDIAREVAAHNKGKTYVPGQLVHNEQVIQELEEENIEFVDSLEKIPEGATTVLRAHGEPGTTYKNLEAKNITVSSNLKDATCPLVTLVHNVAIKLKNEGYDVAIFGKHDHPESIGTSYHIKGKNTYIIEKPDQHQEYLAYLEKNNIAKAAIISQTTMSVHGYKQLIENLNKEKKFSQIPLSLATLDSDFGWVDTICNPTKQRQLGTEELAKEADIMVVIGGLHSSNSKELAAKCRALGVETHYVQNPDQIEEKWFQDKKHIGVSAGASTPDVLIESVVEHIKGLIQS